LPIAGFVSVLLVIERALILGSRHFGLEVMGTPAPHAADYSNTKELGRLLYTDYVYAFELAAVILLVAIVAAIALTLRRRKDSKYIDPAEQVKVKRNDRLRIVKMQSTPKPGTGEGGA
jgi:NADH-quinone oxidoreductase subunit J